MGDLGIEGPTTPPPLNRFQKLLGQCNLRPGYRWEEHGKVRWGEPNWKERRAKQSEITWKGWGWFNRLCLVAFNLSWISRDTWNRKERMRRANFENFEPKISGQGPCEQVEAYRDIEFVGNRISWNVGCKTATTPCDYWTMEFWTKTWHTSF